MGHQLGICHSFPCLFCVSGLSLRVTSQGHLPASHPFSSSFFSWPPSLLTRVTGTVGSVSPLSYLPTSLVLVAELSSVKQIMSLLALVLAQTPACGIRSFWPPRDQTLAPLSSPVLASLPPSFLRLQPRWPLMFPAMPRS